MIESLAAYRDSLRSFDPVVYVDGRRIESVADEPALQPGINAIGVTHAHRTTCSPSSRRCA